MMKFKPLDDCEVHGVWVGLPAFAWRSSHQTSGSLLSNQGMAKGIKHASSSDKCIGSLYDLVLDEYREVVSLSLSHSVEAP